MAELHWPAKRMRKENSYGFKDDQGDLMQDDVCRRFGPRPLDGGVRGRLARRKRRQ